MKISKYIHSCLLLEKDGIAVLMDPGNYTLEENAFHVDDLDHLDFVLITHEHEDHMSVPLLKTIIEKFPDVRIITNGVAADLLAKSGIQASIQAPDFVEMVAIPHEKVLALAPHNTLFHVFGEITHPGDSLQFTESKDILALPIQAPWGSMVAALEKAVEVKPRLIMPIHDWHWKDEARRKLYKMAANYLRERGIEEFRGLEVGESIDIIHS